MTLVCGWPVACGSNWALVGEGRHISEPIGPVAGGLSGFPPRFVSGWSPRSFYVRSPMNFSQKSLSDHPAKHGKIKNRLFCESYLPRVAIFCELVTHLTNSDSEKTDAVLRFCPESVSLGYFTGNLILPLSRDYDQRCVAVKQQRKIEK